MIVPTDEDWILETAEAVGVLKRKKSWSAPGLDRLVNFWWKCAHALHEGVARPFEAISRIELMMSIHPGSLKEKHH